MRCVIHREELTRNYMATARLLDRSKIIEGIEGDDRYLEKY